MPPEIEPLIGEYALLPTAQHAQLQEKLNGILSCLSIGGNQLNLLQMLDVRVQAIGSILYTITTTVSFNGKEMPATIKLHEKLWENTQKIEIKCDDGNQSFTLKADLRQKVRSGANTKSNRAENAALDDGEWHELSAKIAEALVQLAEQSKVYFALERIERVGTTNESGTKYFVRAKLVDTHLERFSCDIVIWEQPWKQFRDVRIKCDNAEYNVVKGAAEL